MDSVTTTLGTVRFNSWGASSWLSVWDANGGGVTQALLAEETDLPLSPSSACTFADTRELGTRVA